MPATHDVFRRTHNALVGMILNSMMAQEEASHAGLRREASDQSWLNEYCTIRVAGPRRTGHSTAIFTATRHAALAGLACQRVVYVKAMSSEDRKRQPICGAGEESLGEIYWTAPGGLKDLGGSRLIFVDNAHFLKEGRRKKIEEYALRSLVEFRCVVLAYVQ